MQVQLTLHDVRGKQLAQLHVLSGDDLVDRFGRDWGKPGPTTNSCCNRGLLATFAIMEPSLAGTTTGANALSVVASIPTAERGRENVGTKEETTEIGLPCDAEGTRDGEDPGKPTPNTRKADVRAPRSGEWAATPSALEDNGGLFVARLDSASAGEETTIQVVHQGRLHSADNCSQKTRVRNARGRSR